MSGTQNVMEEDVGSGSAGPGCSRYLCLHALIVALNETCDGKSWYTSTKELQLASLDFCMACRTYKTLNLSVDENTPRRLLTGADGPPLHPKRLTRTRVPRLRARRVTWHVRTEAQLRNPIFAMTDVDCLKFGRAFEGALEAVAWPRRLKTIEFHHYSRFNKPIDLVEWPEYLQRLEFGLHFNQPLDRVQFPALLQRLVLDGYFDQPITGVVLPASLQQLDLGGYFHPIDDVAWPSSLQQLRFGDGFNQPIERVLWPDSLQRLAFGRWFNQSVDDVRWPGSLQEVTFGSGYSSRDDSIMLYSEFNQPISSSHWPASLRRLTVGGKFRQSLQRLRTWMPNLEALCVLDWEYDDRGVPSHGDSLLRGIEWPKGLRELTVFDESNLDGVDIPSIVKAYRPDLDLP